MSHRIGDWFQSVKGRRIYPLDPRPEDVDIEEIAHSLSHICRFNGHVPGGHYSVAEHSVYVMQYVLERGADAETARVALLHDAPEAYVGDIIRPVKRSDPAIHNAIATAERAWERAIGEALGVVFPYEMPALVKEADDAVLMAERRDLLARTGCAWRERTYTPWGGTIRRLSAVDARDEFLAAWCRAAR